MCPSNPSSCLFGKAKQNGSAKKEYIFLTKAWRPKRQMGIEIVILMQQSEPINTILRCYYYIHVQRLEKCWKKFNVFIIYYGYHFMSSTAVKNNNVQCRQWGVNKECVVDRKTNKAVANYEFSNWRLRYNQIGRKTVKWLAFTFICE